MRRLGLIAVWLVACAGCGPREAPTDVVPLTEVPANLLTVAERALPKARLESARRRQVRGQEVYQIRAKLPGGKIREVDVAASGEVIDSR